MPAPQSPTELILDDADGLQTGARYPAIWLRDNCPCPECAVPGSGQKLFGITDLPRPDELRIEHVDQNTDDGSITIVFAPDGHKSRYERAWLQEHRPDSQARPHDDRTEDAKILWQAADLADAVPEATWEAFAHDPAERARCLESLDRKSVV